MARMMTPEDDLTALLTRGVAVFTERDVPDTVPDALTEPIQDGEGVANGHA